MVDTELTGLDEKKDSIVSLGAIRMNGGAIDLGNSFSRLVSPRTALSASIVVIHEITPSDVEAKPDDAVLKEFLDFCDEYGLYEEEETAVCFVGTHRHEPYQGCGASQSDTAFTDRYRAQLREMIDRDKLHPSVILWSIGNENQYGSNFQASYEVVKRLDTSRPVLFSYPARPPRAGRRAAP